MRDGRSFGQAALPEGAGEFAVVALGAFVRGSEQQARAQAGDVARVLGLPEVGDVVVDLVGDTEGFTVGAENVGDFVVQFDASEDRTDAQGDLECRRGFLFENIEHLQARERLGLACPEEFRALAAAEFALAGGGDGDHGGALFGADVRGGEQAVAFADEEVADIQRDGDAMLGVQRGLAVARGVLVLDVVVDERGLVEAFDGDGDFLQVLGHRGIRAGEGTPCGDGEEGPPAFAGAGEPFTSDALGLVGGRAHDGGERCVGEPCVHFAAQ